MNTHYGYWSQIEPPPPEPRTAHRCGTKGCDKMIPVERPMCRTCRPKAPRPGYVRPEVRQSAFKPVASVAKCLEDLGLSRGPM
jgi:hypothetical protein